MIQISLNKILTVIGVTLFSASTFATQLVWSPQGWVWDGEAALPAERSESAQEALSLMNQAKREADAGNHSHARKLYKEVTEKFSGSPYAGESWFQIGLLEEKEKNWEKSFKAFQKVIDEYAGYGNFNQVISAQYQVAEGLMQGNRVKFLGTIPIFKSPGVAIKQFNDVIKNAPFSEYAPLALFNIALLNRSGDNPVETIDALDRFMNSYPRHFLLPDAYLLMAQTHASLVSGAEYDQGATRDAISYYEDFLIRFPKSPLVAEAEKGLEEMRQMLGESKLQMGDWYYRYRGNGKASKTLYNEVLTTAPGTQAAERAEVQLSRIEAGNIPNPGFWSRLWGSSTDDLEETAVSPSRTQQDRTPPPSSLTAE